MVKHIDFSTLMASTVHDMKNIIAAVSHAYESLLAEMPEALQRSPQARLIEQEALRLDAMLMQLLGLYKLEHGQLLLQAVYCPLDEVFEDLHNRHRELLNYRNIDLQIELENPDLEGYFDISLIGTVLDNALGNAINYCKKTIRLSAQRQDNGILLSISDDGAGYPESLLGTVRNSQYRSIGFFRYLNSRRPSSTSNVGYLKVRIDGWYSCDSFVRGSFNSRTLTID